MHGTFTIEQHTNFLKKASRAKSAMFLFSKITEHFRDYCTELTPNYIQSVTLYVQEQKYHRRLRMTKCDLAYQSSTIVFRKEKPMSHTITFIPCKLYDGAVGTSSIQAQTTPPPMYVTAHSFSESRDINDNVYFNLKL